MLFKNLLNRLLVLLALAASFGITHAVLHTSRAKPLAELIAPSYVPLTPSEVKIAHAKNVEETYKWKAGYEARCQNQLANIWWPEKLKECLKEGAQSLREAKAPPISEVHAAHAQAYIDDEISPRVEMLTNYAFPWMFGVLYASVCLLALGSLWSWFKSYALPVIQLRLRTLISLARQAKAWNAGRGMRNATREFADLNTLHANGLISDDAFLKHKAAIKVALEKGALATHQKK